MLAVTYLISTHFSYHVPLLRLLGSMRSTVEPSSIRIVCGGCPQDSEALVDGIQWLGVTHNSFDFTALIELDRLEPADFVFPLHDTMEFSPDTDRLIRSADGSYDAVAVYDGQCGLCLYRTGYLMARLPEIKLMANCSKQDAVVAERWLWDSAKKRSEYPNAICTAEQTKSPYGGVDRIKEMYTAVELVKWKSQWGQAAPKDMTAVP